MSLQLSCRADLFRVAWRFSMPGKGVRIEPAAQGGVIIGATDAAAFAVLDRTAEVERAALVDAPREFMEAVARTRRANNDPSAVRLHARHGVLACDGVAIIVENAVQEVAPDAWRQAIDRNAFARIVSPCLAFSREVIEDVAEAARQLARAAHRPQHEAEEARFTIKGGIDGAVMVEFAAWPDAFALIADVQTGDGGQWGWAPPDWLAPQMRVGEVESAA